MKRKLLSILALLCLTVTSAWADTVTWDNSTFSSFFLDSDGNSYSDGTISITSHGSCTFVYNTMDLSYGNGSFTFTAENGNISEIAIYTPSYVDVVGMEWIYDPAEEKLTWSGTPAQTVELIGNGPTSSFSVDKIEFTISGGSPSITWDSSVLYIDLSSNQSFGYGGITASVNGMAHFSSNSAFFNDTNDRLTFSTVVGNILKIEILCGSVDGDFEIWTKNENQDQGTTKLTWIGDNSSAQLMLSSSSSTPGNISGISQIKFTVSEVPPADYLMNANLANGYYWSTFYSNVGNYQAPSGTQVFTVTLSGTTLTMNEITSGIVKSGEGVVLRSSSPTITVTRTESSATGYSNNNNLKGTMTQITNPGNAYVLANPTGGNGVGFYKLKSNGTIGANKAYLTYSGTGTQAREFFGFDESTGITTTDCTDYTDETGTWFMLDGRRIQGKPSKQGIYINNGKKVVIK